MKNIKNLFNLNLEMLEIAKLASPLMVTQLAQVALSTIDILMLGMLGTKALAAGGLAITIFALLRTFGNGIISAISNIIAYEHGNDPLSPTISQVTRAGFILAILLALIFYVLTFGIKPLLIFSGQDLSIVPATIEYLQIALIGMAPCLGFLVLRNFTVGLRKPGKLMIFTLISIGLKIGFNYWLLFGGLGVPALGLIGIAWANNLVFLSSFLLFAVSLAKNPAYTAFQLFSKNVTANYHALLSVIKMGLPIAITYLAESGFFMVIALLMGRVSEVALAAHTIVNQCVYITFMLAVGISHATSMCIGNAYGSKNYSNLRRYAQAALVFGLICMSITGISFWLFNHQIIQIFIKDNSSLNDQVHTLASQLLIVAAIFQIFDGWQNIAIGTLRGLKAMQLSMWVSLIGYWLIGLPLAYWFGFCRTTSAIGIWYGLASGLAVTAILLILCCERQFRLHLRG